MTPPVPVPGHDRASVLARALATVEGADEPAWRELMRFLPDVARLLSALARDPRVPWRAKAVSAGTLAYVVSPVDLVPDLLPGVGQLDDLYLVLWAVRRLVATAGYDLVREHWPGTEDGFVLLLLVAGVEG